MIRVAKWFFPVIVGIMVSGCDIFDAINGLKDGDSSSTSIPTGGQPPAPATIGQPPAPATGGQPPAPATGGQPPAPATGGQPPAPATGGQPPAPATGGQPPAPATGGQPPAPATGGQPPAPATSGQPPAPASDNYDPSSITDATIDTDGDLLIEISSIQQLSNMRYNLSATSYKDGVDSEGIRCSNGDERVDCIGYELTSDLIFSDGSRVELDIIDSSQANEVVWQPIGAQDKDGLRFSAIFEGNGYSIRGLYIDIREVAYANQSYKPAGLFGATSSSAIIRNVGIVSIYVEGSAESEGTVGSLVGLNRGKIVNSMVYQGIINGGSGDYDYIGGLVGYNRSGQIISSSAVSVIVNGGEGDEDYVGGLVGSNDLGEIATSYARAFVMGDHGEADSVGGLAGHNAGLIVASYAAADINGGGGEGDTIAGLVGLNWGEVYDSFAVSIMDGGDDEAFTHYTERSDLLAYDDGGSVSNSYGFGLYTQRGTPIFPQYLRNIYSDIADSAVVTPALLDPDNGISDVKRWSATLWDFGDERQYPTPRLITSYDNGQYYCDQALLPYGHNCYEPLTDRMGWRDLYERQQALNAPLNFRVSSRGQNHILDWNVVPGAQTYRVYKSSNSVSPNTSPAHHYRLIAITTEPSYVDSDISDFSLYRVVAVDEFAGLPTPSQEPQSSRVSVISLIDQDNDGLIDINNLEQLFNIRYSLDGSAYKTSKEDVGLLCGLDGTMPCRGYELTRSLDFASPDSYADNVVNSEWVPNSSNPDIASNSGWLPIGLSPDIEEINGVNDWLPPFGFRSIFDGNGHTISNLYVRRGGISALFSMLDYAAVVRNLGIIDGRVYGGDAQSYPMSVNSGYTVYFSHHVGSLAAINKGTIVASYATGGVALTGKRGPAIVGGLVGALVGGRIVASYADVEIHNVTNMRLDNVSINLGGLVGQSVTTQNRDSTLPFTRGNLHIVKFENGRGIIADSYAKGNVYHHRRGYQSKTNPRIAAGGLIGRGMLAGVVNVYAEGHVSGSTAGRLVGNVIRDFRILAGWGFGRLDRDNDTSSGGFYDIVLNRTGLLDEGTLSYYLPSYLSEEEHRDPEGYRLYFGSIDRSYDTYRGPRVAEELTYSNSSTTASDRWSQDIWDFGSSNQTPALRYADYDEAGSIFSCSQGSWPGSELCGELIPGQR